ncbi:uncharacterized protein [Drosophila kikkawai]|uniref:Beta-defensin n=1 Tax=Drosophila kikkawai TaxID=30033 RepID=A0A6P4IV65_DROKI|nr:uncharacterized protein LOC108081769 [Drosophila kikkawai]KAH8343708.1 hypothetical protein KR059_005252 [Drosophila kikkawai]
MSNQLPCLFFLLLITILLLLFGGYYTYKYKKINILASCYHMGGKCLELENCEDHQSKLLTTCVNKRKVCCVKETEDKHLEYSEEYGEVP